MGLSAWIARQSELRIVLLFSFEGLELLERMANGPLIAEMADLLYGILHKAIGYRL
jgi:hypothetical protein